MARTDQHLHRKRHRQQLQLRVHSASSASEISTITMTAMTGSASRSPVENIVDPTRICIARAARQDERCQRERLQAAGEDAQHFAIQPRGEEQQAGRRSARAPPARRNRPAYWGRPWKRKSSPPAGPSPARPQEASVTNETTDRPIPMPSAASTSSHITRVPLLGYVVNSRPQREKRDRDAEASA